MGFADFKSVGPGPSVGAVGFDSLPLPPHTSTKRPQNPAFVFESMSECVLYCPEASYTIKTNGIPLVHHSG